jgi:16S rRNA (uracil1498-N3)-methyltransferase
VPRRLYVKSLHAGSIDLDESESHHVRDVLRLDRGQAVELFDGSGAAGHGLIERCDARGVSIRVEVIYQAPAAGEIVVAAAIPKGHRADWMIEKLSELGVGQFIPLKTERAVVLPSGAGKIERWRRIAVESAKQSRRDRVMTIAELCPLEAVIVRSGIFLTTEAGAEPLPDVLKNRQSTGGPLLVIGPEGGWTEVELAQMRQRGLTGARLTATILRVETAAIAAAAVAATAQ